MRRLVAERLLAWKNAPDRHPLLVRGARQVGKTWSVVDFGRAHFPGAVHVIDFEQRPAARDYFQGDLDPRKVLSGLELLLGAPVRAGRDLLFLDEIQACPRALVALRYFYEQMPELHVVAAGSLVEFALAQISFPVGRIDYLTMWPMTFVEYLWAIGNEMMAEVVLAGPRAQPETTHTLVLEELRRYLYAGGMPAAVSAYAAGLSLRAAFARQDALVQSYRDDFGKYASESDQALPGRSARRHGPQRRPAGQVRAAGPRFQKRGDPRGLRPTVKGRPAAFAAHHEPGWAATGALGQPPALQGAAPRRRTAAAPLRHARRHRVRQGESSRYVLGCAGRTVRRPGARGFAGGSGVLLDAARRRAARPRSTTWSPPTEGSSRSR